MKIPEINFIEFPKIARLSREVIVTEKLDGTNAQVFIPETPDIRCICNSYRTGFHGPIEHLPDGGCRVYHESDPCMRQCECKAYQPDPERRIFAGSRSQWITPEKDNAGFARWVEQSKDELFKLGPGSHFGEWWGSGIQRGYGLTKGEKRFSLFNVSRWGPGGKDEAMKPACCGTVPVLHRGAFQMEAIDAALKRLRENGSVAAPGFMRPEGVVVFHTAANICFKKTIDGDAQPKGANR